ncbi:class I SAM-dependent methyltransferase [Candidatus Parcubacteria bacterium]|nr:MAG: class I SAM-dependent methyltransferase [Candidatus Parcubacteria bacterium]
MTDLESLAFGFGRGLEKSETDTIYRNMLLAFEKKAIPFPKQGKILEVGSGNGNFLEHMRAKGLDVEGVDIAPRGPNVLKADAKHLPYNDETFDLIISKQVFDGVVYDQYPEDQRVMLREMARVLKKDGCYYAMEVFFEDIEGLERIPGQDSVGTIYRKP